MGLWEYVSCEFLEEFNLVGSHWNYLSTCWFFFFLDLEFFFCMIYVFCIYIDIFIIYYCYYYFLAFRVFWGLAGYECKLLKYEFLLLFWLIWDFGFSWFYRFWDYLASFRSLFIYFFVLVMHLLLMKFVVNVVQFMLENSIYCFFNLVLDDLGLTLFMI